MATPENDFITSVHRHLPASLYRMKNHNQYNGGIADVWYSGNKDLWVEYKFITVPKRPDTVIDLISKPPKGDSIISTLQKEWLESRHAEGRAVGVIIGCKGGGVWCPGLSWIWTWSASQFTDDVRSRSELAEQIQKAVS